MHVEIKNKLEINPSHGIVASSKLGRIHGPKAQERR